jgi:hypothetical protein
MIKRFFTYVGSLDVWQCFDETIELYKEIESKLCDTKLRVYTFDVESARRRIIEKEIKNYSVERVPKNEVANRMNEVSYGFVIRKDNIINRVATPTKLSTYLASGVIPIFSDCLQDFYNLSKAMKYVYAVPSIVDVDSIIEFCRKPIIVNEIKEEYKAVFNSYYSKEKYIKEISSFFIDDIRNSVYKLSIRKMCAVIIVLLVFLGNYKGIVANNLATTLILAILPLMVIMVTIKKKNYYFTRIMFLYTFSYLDHIIIFAF